MLCAIRSANTGSSERHCFPFHRTDHHEQTHVYCVLLDMMCVHENISSSVQLLSRSQKTRSSSANQDDQSTNCIDLCLSHTSKTRFMYTSQDSSLVRHFWQCCRAGTCTAQRSRGCRTGCVCDKHTVNKAGKHARSGTTTDPASLPSTCIFLLNSAVRHASWKGESCRFAKKDRRNEKQQPGLKTRLSAGPGSNTRPHGTLQDC